MENRPTSLLHDCVCSMTGLDFCIDRYVSFGNRAVPDIMIPFAAPHKRTPILLEYLADLFLVFCHYRAILSIRSAWKLRTAGISVLFISSSSGAAKRTRSSKASKEPDSKTRPGMSSLVATHTLASGSHVKFTTHFMLKSSLPYYSKRTFIKGDFTQKMKSPHKPEIIFL